MTEPRWPIDTTAGRVVTAVAFLFMAVGGWLIRVDQNWWGLVPMAVAVGLALGFRELFLRGYFGHKRTFGPSD